MNSSCAWVSHLPDLEKGTQVSGVKQISLPLLEPGEPEERVGCLSESYANIALCVLSPLTIKMHQLITEELSRVLEPSLKQP